METNVSANVSVKSRRTAILVWTVISTLVAEAITAYLRFRRGITATEFNTTAPFLLQIHHMFWSLPLLVIVRLAWRKPKLGSALLGIACGLILSDLLHHFLVLPLTVGNTGWHWP